MIFGPKEKIVSAVEIGTTTTAGAVGKFRPGENVRILGLGIAPTSGVRKGEVIHKAQVNEALRFAVLKAEENSGETIDRVFLALSGAHLQCINRRAKLAVNGEGGIVSSEDIEALKKIAEDVHLPSERLRVVTLPKGYRLDGGETLSNPAGLAGQIIEGDFMIVHGVTSRLTNIISRVTELNIEVRNFTLSAIAAADATLNSEARQLGSLVIDLGGGLTNYALYLNGQLDDVGSIGVGGDHVTQDLAKAFNIPTRTAEELKVNHGCVVVEKSRRDEIVQLKPSASFPGKKVYLDSVANVINLRMEEVFSIIKERIGRQRLSQIGGGVFLTGGTSKIRGLDRLAEVVFEKAVNNAMSNELTGAVEDLSQPALSVVFGTLLYGKRIIEAEEGRSSLASGFKRIFARAR